jgi:uncharacterized damage-inducible protein DinB
MNPRELLVDTFAYMPPARVLERLASDEAERRAPGANHSIAELVAHLAFWQDWFLRRCEGRAEPMVKTAAQGWPDVARGTWPELERRFLSGLDRAVALGEAPGRASSRIEPAIEFPPLAQYTVGDVLVHLAGHNGHHLGQVIALRQVMGLWPPPSGSWTW